ncbi:Interleukin-1 family member 10, partial [Ophiophagus hannah]
MAVVPNDNLDFRNRPIFMGLTGKTKALSCLKSITGEPQLVILEKNIMDFYRDTKEFKNFSFYVVTRGNKSNCWFESAAFPGWFLSTSIHPNMPVGLCKQGAYYPDLKMSCLKPSKPPHVLEPLRLREPRLFRIWDISQKFLFIVNSMLIANPLDFNSPDPRQQPIFMGLTDGSHTLSCTSSSEGQPQLHLVMDGSSETCSFESAQFPGWFISTSSEPNKPINLGQKGGTEITLFYFETSERKEKGELVITRVI